ncbi:MAG: hypothetical protein DME99_04865 [Verrucomicrobia bacterium]|nr:MAG: hypothetical protein DME99_04865 [Verrucomicrobiota bacterium]
MKAKLPSGKGERPGISHSDSVGVALGYQESDRSGRESCQETVDMRLLQRVGIQAKKVAAQPNGHSLCRESF